jgi:hypothetical protein
MRSLSGKKATRLIEALAHGVFVGIDAIGEGIWVAAAGNFVGVWVGLVGRVRVGGGVRAGIIGCVTGIVSGKPGAAQAWINTSARDNTRPFLMFSFAQTDI